MSGLIMKYFVLKPRGSSPHSLASRNALRAYAQSIRSENAELADDLQNWADTEADIAAGIKQPEDTTQQPLF